VTFRIVLLLLLGATAAVLGHMATVRLLKGQPVASPPVYRFITCASVSACVYN
jgi:hypothetical protein